MVSTYISLWPLLLFFALGYLARKTHTLPETTPHILNGAIIRFIFPITILLNIPALEIGPEMLIAAVMPWIALGFAVVMVLVLSRITHLPPDIRCALLVLAALGNTGFLGVPMVKVLFGGDAIGYAVIYDQLGTFIAVSTYGVILVSSFREKGQLQPLKMLRSILLFPPLITLVVALFLAADTLAPIEQPLRWISWLLIPLTMLSIGMQFRFRVEADFVQPLLAALVIKMALAPLLIYAIVRLLPISPEIFTAVVFQTATPPMVTGAILLLSRGIAPQFTASVLGFGTLIALVWLPLVALMLR